MLEHFQFKCRALPDGRASVRRRERKRTVLYRKSETALGLGPTIIREFGKKHIFVNSAVSAIVADPAKTNLRSVRAFEKAGFMVVRTVQLSDEGFDRLVVRLNRP